MLRGLAIAATLGAVVGMGAQPEGPMPAGHEHLVGRRPGADWPKARAGDVNSIDAIIRAFYEAPAGEPGAGRDWTRYQSLFVPDARLIAARPGEGGTAGTLFLPVAAYIATNRTYFERGGFVEREAARRTEEYGNIAQVWSTYESRHRAGDAAPYSRGVYSIQLLKDGERWWIVNVFWDFERPENPIPAKYLGG